MLAFPFFWWPVQLAQYSGSMGGNWTLALQLTELSCGWVYALVYYYYNYMFSGLRLVFLMSVTDIQVHNATANSCSKHLTSFIFYFYFYSIQSQMFFTVLSFRNKSKEQSQRWCSAWLSSLPKPEKKLLPGLSSATLEHAWLFFKTRLSVFNLHFKTASPCSHKYKRLKHMPSAHFVLQMVLHTCKMYTF